MAYIHMLASACGLTLGEWSQDYDCQDVTLSSSVDYTPDMYAPKIDIQLKCTGQIAVDREDSVAWGLKSRSYEKLTKLNRSTPALFCVLVASGDAGMWLNTDTKGMLAKSHMYWRWGSSFDPLIVGQDSQTVHLPKANLLTPSSLLDLMKEASKWQPTLTPTQ